MIPCKLAMHKGSFFSAGPALRRPHEPTRKKPFTLAGAQRTSPGDHPSKAMVLPQEKIHVLPD
jgi:hypothetical protein